MQGGQGPEKEHFSEYQFLDVDQVNIFWFLKLIFLFMIFCEAKSCFQVNREGPIKSSSEVRSV